MVVDILYNVSDIPEELSKILSTLVVIIVVVTTVLIAFAIISRARGAGMVAIWTGRSRGSCWRWC